MPEDATAKPGPTEQVSKLYEDLEAQAARASEELVSGSGFTGMLTSAAENVAALTKLSGDTMDLILRNLRLAGRRQTSPTRQVHSGRPRRPRSPAQRPPAQRFPVSTLETISRLPRATLD